MEDTEPWVSGGGKRIEKEKNGQCRRGEEEERVDSTPRVVTYVGGILAHRGRGGGRTKVAEMIDDDSRKMVNDLYRVRVAKEEAESDRDGEK